MNCKRAEKLMMNYMDNTLSEEDAKKLNEHIKVCKECKESFLIYEMFSVENKEIIEAPENFEQEVMMKISAITPAYLTKENISMDSINAVIWGTFAMLFGIGIMFNLYDSQILNYISQNEVIASLYQTVTPIGNFISKYINDSFEYLQKVILSMNNIITYSKIICAVLIIILSLVQIKIKNRDKVDA